jgi:hypothetical protein
LYNNYAYIIRIIDECNSVFAGLFYGDQSIASTESSSVNKSVFTDFYESVTSNLDSVVIFSIAALIVLNVLLALGGNNNFLIKLAGGFVCFSLKNFDLFFFLHECFLY